LLTTNQRSDSLCSDWRGKIFRLLSKFLHELLFLHPVIILLLNWGVWQSGNILAKLYVIILRTSEEYTKVYLKTGCGSFFINSSFTIIIQYLIQHYLTAVVTRAL